MQKDIALEYAEMDMFLQLSEGSIEGDDLLCVGDAKIGVLIENDHYFLINKKTDIDQEIIYNIYKMLEFK